MRDEPLTVLADIGGTNARFALYARGRGLAPVTVLSTRDYESACAAFGAYLDAQGRPAIRAAAVCAAGPHLGDAIAMTNCPWTVSKAEIAAGTGTGRIMLCNDFEAIAASLPHLKGDDVTPIGSGLPDKEAPKAVLGPGTGLGMAAVISVAGRWHALASEGGHADLAPSNARELAILAHLLPRLGHVSAERLLSGPGLALLWRTLGELDGAQSAEALSPSEIAARARKGGDPRAREAVALFTGWLGAVAGDLALTLNARGGIYLAGGIIPEWGDQFDGALFRRRFEAKGRFAAIMARIPVWRIDLKYVALWGLAHLSSATGEAP
ncbi:MAG: glucokinase [Alphaproteobacteria bacterium]|nr:glucokinase [Alphaproteobacteria bacterium]